MLEVKGVSGLRESDETRINHKLIIEYNRLCANILWVFNLHKACVCLGEKGDLGGGFFANNYKISNG